MKFKETKVYQKAVAFGQKANAKFQNSKAKILFKAMPVIAAGIIATSGAAKGQQPDSVDYNVTIRVPSSVVVDGKNFVISNNFVPETPSTTKGDINVHMGKQYFEGKQMVIGEIEGKINTDFMPFGNKDVYVVGGIKGVNNISNDQLTGKTLLFPQLGLGFDDGNTKINAKYGFINHPDTVYNTLMGAYTHLIMANAHLNTVDGRYTFDLDAVTEFQFKQNVGNTFAFQTSRNFSFEKLGISGLKASPFVLVKFTKGSEELLTKDVQYALVAGGLGISYTISETEAVKLMLMGGKNYFAGSFKFQDGKHVELEVSAIDNRLVPGMNYSKVMFGVNITPGE